jgi:hypothetical protein
VQDVAREDRQQDRDASDQHGEHVERGGAEQDTITEEIAKTGKQRFQRDRLFLRNNALHHDQHHQHAGGDPEERREAVDHGRSENIEKAAERGTDDGRGLLCGSEPRHRPRHVVRWNQVRHHRAHRRKFERPHAADQKHERVDENAVEPPRQGAGDQHQRATARPQLTEADHLSAVVAVGDVADWDGEHHQRQKLREPYETESERAVGDVVELPGQRHHRHLVGQHRNDPAEPKQEEGAMRQDRRRDRCSLFLHPAQNSPGDVKQEGKHFALLSNFNVQAFRLTA